MEADQPQIETIRSQTLAQLELITASPDPTYTLNGVEVSWRAYAEALRETVDWCDRQLADGRPFEVRSSGVRQ